MSERLLKSYLTVETGEAYQPIRLTYTITEKNKLVELLNRLKCCEANSAGNSWNWFWRDECDAVRFQSLESYQRNPKHPPRLGTFTIRDDIFYINLPSFKRACLVMPFLHEQINGSVSVDKADFINKVFGLDERLPHGFTNVFKEEELEKTLNQRVADFAAAQEKVEQAETPEEAMTILTDYTHAEAQKRLPYAERYSFLGGPTDPEITFLGFFIYLRSRELVAIRRWFGETGYTLSDAAEETVEKIFGDIDIDIIE